MTTSEPIVMSDTPSADDKAELEERLYAFNMDRTDYRDGRHLSCFVRDDTGALVAGVDGFTWGGYARIEYLWVAEPRRGEGLGRRLLEAAARGCGTVILSSHEFQAYGQYSKHGYDLVGTTEDTPVGYRQFLYQKHLPLPSRPR